MCHKGVYSTLWSFVRPLFAREVALDRAWFHNTSIIRCYYEVVHNAKTVFTALQVQSSITTKYLEFKVINTEVILAGKC